MSPTNRVDYSIPARNARKLGAAEFVNEYPHLLVFDRHDVYYVYRRHIRADGYWDGLIQETEPFPFIRTDSKTLHKDLLRYEAIAALAQETGGFICTACVKVRAQSELAGTNFLGHYCMPCCETKPEVKKRVDEARRPGYYD